MKTYFLFKGLLFVGVCGLLTGCDKDNSGPCGCPELKLVPNALEEYPTRGPRFGYARPYFNPENSREVIFFKRDEQDPGVAGIWKTNLDTKRQTQVLAGNDIFLQLRWGPQGWLALSKNHQVWKVKSTGDSLTQLTYGVPHYQPQWSPDGQRLVCWQDGPTAAAQGLVFLDRKGGARTAPAEPLKGYAEGWSSDGTKLLLQHTADGVFGLGVYTFASNKVDLIVPVDIKAGHGGIHGAAWLPNGNGFVWSSDLGLFRTDLASRRTVTLHTGCSGRIYIHPSISSDGRTLIVERVDRHAEDNGRAIYGETNLWTMDLDGSNQRKVEF